jgi:DNA replication and repair protein RecF
MQLLSLTATNFRNLQNLQLEFPSRITAFIGENGQGKTNILEAIATLALGKSLRAGSDAALVQHGAEFFRLTAAIQNSKSVQLELAYQAAPRQTKVCKVGGRAVPVGELIGQLPIVFFQPEDLNLVLLEPSRRRRYLDILLAQVSRAYIAASSGYAKALKNRNALLSQIAENQASEAELEFWDLELARHGTVIGQKRAELLEFAVQPLAANFAKISAEERVLTAKLTGFDGAALTPEKYLANLQKLRPQDLKYGTTNYGPHRQDLVFELNGESVAVDGSRGEIRSTILALKLTELAFLESKTGTQPILLLDDVYSELDRGRQERLMNLLGAYQTFITTTKIEHLDALLEKQVWEVKNGAFILLK